MKKFTIIQNYSLHSWGPDVPDRGLPARLRGPLGRRPRRRAAHALSAGRDSGHEWIILNNVNQTSRVSFSAVSTPILVSKYSLESSRRDLHNALLCTVLQTQNFSQKSPTFFRDWIIEFSIFSFSSSNFAFFLRIFDVFFPDFAPNSRKECRLSLFNQFCENKLENCRKFWNLWKLFNIIQYYSIVSLTVPLASRS